MKTATELANQLCLPTNHASNIASHQGLERSKIIKQIPESVKIEYPTLYVEDYPQIPGTCGELCSNCTTEMTASEKTQNKIWSDLESGMADMQDMLIFYQSAIQEPQSKLQTLLQ